MRPIDADAIVFDYSGLAYIGPHDYRDIAKYFADQIARQPTLTPHPQEQMKELYPGCDFCKKELNDYPFITAMGEYGDSVKSHTPQYCPLCGRPLTPEAGKEMKKKLERCMENDLPLQYYPAYRKALRDLKTAIEMVGDNFKRYGMNNWKGMVKVIDVVLKDPEKLMYTASLKGYDIPEPYLSKWRKWQQKKKLEILKDGKSD